MIMPFTMARMFIAILFAVSVVAQSSTSQPSSTSLSLSVTTSTSVSLRTSRGQVSSVPVPTTFNVTYTITPTPTSSTGPSSTQSSISASTSASATPSPNVLDTKLDPAFGVLGGLLVVTGLPSAFWGHKNRWTSFFLIGFYTLSLVCIVLILKFGVLAAVNPPTKTLRGMFVLASAVAGIAGGGIAIFFWQAAKFFIGAWGGFAVGLFIQCFRNGGLIQSDGLRWILYIGCTVVGFVLCTIPKIHYHILLVSTAVVGATAFMLGVDCFTTAGLKEFYIWNLGFSQLFPKFTRNGIQFPVSQTMQIELGLMGAVALMGIAVQLRVLKVLQRKLREIQEEQKRRDEEAEAQAADRFTGVMQEREEWERAHPTMSGKHNRHESGYSSMPLMKDQEAISAATPEPRSSTFTLVSDGRPRYQSGVSEFHAAPAAQEEARRLRQTAGALPALDLGLGIQDDVPSNFIAEGGSTRASGSDPEDAERARILTEIQTIRRSIDALKSETPAPSSSSESRRPSMTSRRTLSIDAHSALLPSTSPHLRPPREHDPRARVQSLELSHLTHGEAIGRPTSAPLRDNDWDSYLHDRKLIQPPSGISPPIMSQKNPSPSLRAPLPTSVVEAVAKRRQRESAIERADMAKDSSSDETPIAQTLHMKRGSSVGHVPVTILPPRKNIVAPTPQKPSPSRTRTFEDLDERHKRKIKEIQAPLSQAEQESAALEAARQRWERSKSAEKEAVTRRQAERAATLEKKKQDGTDPIGSSNAPPRHSRSLSADKLGSSSKRMSTMKVQDWQKQQEGGSNRDSRVGRVDELGVPFPEDKPKDRNSRRLDRRDPPS